MPLKSSYDTRLCCLDKKVDALKSELNTAEATITTLEDDVNTLQDARSAPGNATLVGGTIAVANPLVTAGSFVFLTRKTAGGTLGNLTYTLSAGVGFTINSTDVADVSTVTHQVIY